MRKTQIALAAVALVASTAAMANGVSVSGSLDVGLASQNATAGGAKTTNFVEGNWNGGSFMTFSGSEDLGGGLKAGFTLQTGFSMKNGLMSNGGTIPTDITTTSSQSVFNRQANVSLGGDFGTVTLGQQLNPYIAGATGTELPNAAFGAFTVRSLLSNGGGGVSNGGFFVANAVSYSTPSIGGLNATVLTQLKGADSAENELIAGSASYNIGDIKLSAGYQDRKGTYSSATGTTTANSGTGYTLGGLIPFGAFSVNLRYSTQNPQGTTAATSAVNAGVAYALNEATTVSAQYSDQSGAGTGNLANLAAYYALSKSTGIYAMYARASGGSTAFYSGGVSSATANVQSWAIGAVKNF